MFLNRKNTLFSQGMRLFGTSLFGVFFASIIVFSLGLLWQGSTGQLVVQAAALLSFCMVAYHAAWAMGEEEGRLSRLEKRPVRSHRGFLVGLAAAVPYACSGLILVLSKLGTIPDVAFLYKLITPEHVFFINWVMPSGYAANDSWGAILLVISYHLALPLTAWLGYLLGTREILLLYRLVFRGPKR